MGKCRRHRWPEPGYAIIYKLIQQNLNHRNSFRGRTKGKDSAKAVSHGISEEH
jgi:hypothetical protein